MDLQEAVYARHSVRSYLDRAIDALTAEELKRCCAELNARSGLRMQLILNEPRAFGGMLSRVGWLSGVKNYLAIVGPADAADLEMRAGYYGECFVLRAQQLGLNSCWVAATYNRGKCAAQVDAGEKLLLVIALGYGKTQGKPHRSKAVAAVCADVADAPEWYRRGVACALLAPTAMNQQRFAFARDGEEVRLTAGHGAYANIDLGIVKRHFEIGAGEEGWKWAK